MAMADYYQCDVCGGKTFYDAELHYDCSVNGSPFPVGAGDMKVICKTCAETHQVVVTEKPKKETHTDAPE
jgi:hypothetical protein